MTSEWQTAGFLYGITLLFMGILKFGSYQHLNLEKNLWMTMMTRWEFIIFISRVLIGWIAPLYIRYLLLGEIIFELFYHYILKQKGWGTLLWGIIGLLVGYIISKLFNDQQKDRNPFTIPTYIAHSFYHDLVSPQTKNPWITEITQT